MIVAIEMPQQPEQHVKHDDGACVADMREVIDRRSADIHAHVFWIERRERPLLLGQRIVEAAEVMESVPCGRASNTLDREKTASASESLAHNLAANATDGEETVHFLTMGQLGGLRQGREWPAKRPLGHEQSGPTWLIIINVLALSE